MDWDGIFRSGGDWRSQLSVRGRNIQFFNRIGEILNLNSVNDLQSFKKGFTNEAVQEIHQAVVDLWPANTDIESVLARSSDDVSGLYLGDYDVRFIAQGIVRHSIYANKILIFDPFIYGPSVREKFNPIINPSQHRTQTLRNVNFWFSLLPWIDAGLVEVIRAPDDFDSKLKFESMQRARSRVDEDPALQKALERSADELTKRHSEQLGKEMLLLGTPDDRLRREFEEHNLGNEGFTADDFIKHVHRLRRENANFLAPIDELGGQLLTMSAGATHEIGCLTADITNSYLVTDIEAKWYQIEADRDKHNAETQVWSAFAKSVQETRLKYLDNIELQHALTLRKENRLQSLRGFLVRVWERARTDSRFDEANARLFADELADEVARAETEWAQIDQDLLKMVKAELSAGLLAAGPLIAGGHGQFLAAAAIAAGAMDIANSTFRRWQFPKKHPAAFFMQIDSEDAD